MALRSFELRNVLTQTFTMKPIWLGSLSSKPEFGNPESLQKNNEHVGTKTEMKIIMFWKVTLRYILKIEAVDYFDTLVIFFQTTWLLHPTIQCFYHHNF